MAIQNRRGSYTNFDPQKLVPGEWAVVQSGDPNSERGRAVYMAFDVGEVERMATYEDMLENIESATSDIQSQFTAEVNQTIADANSAVSTMQTNINNEISSATRSVNTLTTQVERAIGNSNVATALANDAASDANEAADAVRAIIESADAVVSWNNRTGTVVPESGDYTSAQITHGNTTVAAALEFDAVPITGSSKAVQSNAVAELADEVDTLKTQLTAILNAITIDSNNNVHFKNLQSGAVSHTHSSGGGIETTDIVFSTPFTTVPNVVATAAASNPEINRATAYAITKTGFTLATYRNAAGTLPAKWIAFV